MFKFFKKGVTLFAPVVGQSIKIEDVSDQMFAQKMLGDGVAFQFDGDTVYAPADAEVIMIANTKHAIGLQIGSAEVLIHIGLDTVKFEGKGFDLLVKQGDKVKRGQALVKLDRQFFSSEDIDMTTPMILTSCESKVSHKSIGEVNLDSEVLELN